MISEFLDKQGGFELEGVIPTISNPPVFFLQGQLAFAGQILTNYPHAMSKRIAMEAVP